MKIGEVVIGSNYGDEGKGLITDYLASREPESTLIVRFNGGAQAGHTVVTPDGRRHVFSHFGSGSFLGCPTYLSQFFIVNPLLFVKEEQVLKGLGVHPLVSIDHMALVTTPFDMFINQTLELKRAGARHGSCGVGINETVTRCLRADQFALRASELPDLKQLSDKLMKLGKSWFPKRLQEVGLSFRAHEVIHFVEKHEEIVARFVDDVSSLLHTATIRQDHPIEKRIIFEGAQGLLLDQDRLDQWPHVTRSRTGLFNALHLARKFQLDILDVNYVSRTYLTRHGAGPLPGESNQCFADRTNIPNQFQGVLRFAPMDWKQLNDSIELDLRQARSAGLKLKASLAMTCLDQEPMPRSIDLVLPIRYTSSGACRTHVENCALMRA